MTSAGASRGLALRVRDLGRRFGPVTALAGVALDVSPGEGILLLGGNGAGKSTLLRMTAGLIRPTTGRVMFGPDFAHGPEAPSARLAIGYLGHKSLLHDYLSARENIELYARLYGASAARAAERAESLLAEVGLSRAADRPARGFSRGMYQRLALARALVHRPGLLLLDEPSTGLDVEGRAMLDAALAAQRADGVTLLHVSHHAESALRLADRVLVLKRGRLVDDAPAGERDAAGWSAHVAHLARGAA